MIYVDHLTNLIISSTDDGSELSEPDFTTPSTLSLAARNNPYVHQDTVQLQMLPLDTTQKKLHRY